MSLIAAAFALAVAPSPPVPIVSVQTGPVRPKITSPIPGDVTCNGARMKPLHIEMPLPMAGSFEGADASRTLEFRIGADGRPTGIAFAGDDTKRVGSQLRDLQPALSAWRFPAGEPRTDCRVTFDVKAADWDQVDPLVAYRYFALTPPGRPGYSQSLSRAIFDRAGGDGSDCTRRPEPRRLVFPDFDRVPQAPGGFSLTVLNYDVDASGRPSKVRVVGSNGNMALDRLSADAFRQSRFAPAARKGCVHYFFRNPAEPLPAPALPDADSFRPAGSTCPSDGEPAWRRKPITTFPEEFRRRGIEGWAVLSYDVAPWGQIGNVNVLTAEPASMFGDQAIQILTTAAKTPSNSGYTGCIARIVFRMEKDEGVEY